MVDLTGMAKVLITIGAVSVLILWGCWELIDFFFIDDAIRVSQPIIPELEIVVKNNIIDTVYIYRKP